MTDPRYMRPGFEFARNKLLEEIGELTERLGLLSQALAKTGRWGLDSVNPELPPEKQETNRDWILRAIKEAVPEFEDYREAVDNIREEIRKVPVLPGKSEHEHQWRYEGTDYHGSHKGEDSYRCTVPGCVASEYRP